MQNNAPYLNADEVIATYKENTGRELDEAVESFIVETVHYLNSLPTQAEAELMADSIIYTMQQVIKGA